MCNAMTGDASAPTIDCSSGTSPSSGFWQGRAWPISEPALAALVDLGLSDERIARYFHVGPDTVLSLRLRFGVEPMHS